MEKYMKYNIKTVEACIGKYMDISVYDMNM